MSKNQKLKVQIRYPDAITGGRLHFFAIRCNKQINFVFLCNVPREIKRIYCGVLIYISHVLFLTVNALDPFYLRLRTVNQYQFALYLIIRVLLFVPLL